MFNFASLLSIDGQKSNKTKQQLNSAPHQIRFELMLTCLQNLCRCQILCVDSSPRYLVKINVFSRCGHLTCSVVFVVSNFISNVAYVKLWRTLTQRIVKANACCRAAAKPQANQTSLIKLLAQSLRSTEQTRMETLVLDFASLSSLCNKSPIFECASIETICMILLSFQLEELTSIWIARAFKIKF